MIVMRFNGGIMYIFSLAFRSRVAVVAVCIACASEDNLCFVE